MTSSPVIKEASKLAGGFNVPDVFPSLKFLHAISKMKTVVEKLHHRVDKILDEVITSVKQKIMQ